MRPSFNCHSVTIMKGTDDVWFCLLFNLVLYPLGFGLVGARVAPAHVYVE